MGIVGFCVLRTRRKERKELEKEQQAALVESFIQVGRDASARNSHREEQEQEQEQGRAQETYLPYRDVQHARPGSAPLRQSGLSEVTLEDAGRVSPRTGL
jgi:hypothetical protein